MPSWTTKKGFDPKLIVQRIDASKSIDANSKVTFDGFLFAENMLLLKAVIELHREITAEEKHHIVCQAVFNAGSKGNITLDVLYREFEKQEREYLSTPPKTFQLVTDLSIERSCKLPSISTAPLRITFKPCLDECTLRVRDKIKRLARNSLFGDYPNDYTSVIVSVKARTGVAAAEKALEHLDCMRGIWNLWINRTRVTGWSHGIRNPINRIVLGPLHTLHDVRGNDAAKGTWWYDPYYHTPIAVYKETTKLPSMLKFTSNVRRELKTHRYKDDLVNLIVRYVRAFDSRDWSDSFLRLWSVLEGLTNTKVSETHKETVQRASFVWSDRDIAHQELFHLRDTRSIGRDMVFDFPSLCHPTPIHCCFQSSCKFLARTVALS